ncbi:cell wall-binding repeat-containing protein [Schumannella luteola]
MSVVRTKSALLAAVVALSLSVPLAATAATGGTISGTVTGTGSAAVAQVYVTAYSDDGRVAGFSSTNASGDYTISNLQPGDYTVSFVDQVAANYATEWYGGGPFRSSAGTITITGTETVDADAELEAGGAITGTVQGQSNIGGGYIVRAFAWDATTETWQEFGSGVGAVAPNYRVQGLPGGLEYRVWFQHYYVTPAFASQFYSNAGSLAAAQPIAVASGATVTGINAVLKPGTSVPYTRVAGADRFQTSAQIALAYDSTSTDYVFLASGLKYPDALSAGPAAAAFDAPLLLTLPDSVPSSVAAQIQRIDPGHIVVVGSSATISDSVITQLQALVPGVDVDRVAGADRFATSRELARYAFGEVGAESVWVATGLNFPDALSASAVGGAFGLPVILVNGGASSVDAATADLLSELRVVGVNIAGGTPSVSEAMADSIEDLAVVQYVNRIAGADRYATSQLINMTYNTRPAEDVYLAVGTGFADALSGAALAARDRAPLFVVPNNCVPVATRQQIFTMSTQQVVLLGGTPSLGVPVQSLTQC